MCVWKVDIFKSFFICFSIIRSMSAIYKKQSQIRFCFSCGQGVNDLVTCKNIVIYLYNDTNQTSLKHYLSLTDIN